MSISRLYLVFLSLFSTCYGIDFEKLPLFFEGDSRILRIDGDHLVGKLKPTIFSLEVNGPITLEGIDSRRTRLNQIFCSYLHANGIRTSTLKTEGDYIYMSKEEVPPIEVVVKGAHVGSPKHLYKYMENYPTRNGRKITPGNLHEPYVRFDWRNPLPDDDLCMPEGLADHFINTAQAKTTALTAFNLLNKFLNAHDFQLLDICYFMNVEGTVICAEISTDNTRIEYIGQDPALKELFSSRDKNKALARADAILAALETPRILLSGPFCTGKTTLIKRINEELGIPKLIDDATRPMRPGESQGFPYHFISMDNFKANVNNGAYFEWVLFNGNGYGVPKKDIYFNKSWILDILSTSLPSYKGQIPGLITVYLEAPSPEILADRARKRGDSEDSIQKRLRALEDEDSNGYDFIISDQSLEKKFHLLKDIIMQEVKDDRAQKLSHLPNTL